MHNIETYVRHGEYLTAEQKARAVFVGMRLDNVMRMFGPDWLGALCVLHGVDLQCSTLICKRAAVTLPPAAPEGVLA